MMAPHVSQSPKCRWAASARIACELAIASAWIANRRFVDLFVPIDFATTRTAMLAADMVGHTMSDTSKRCHVIAYAHVIAKTQWLATITASTSTKSRAASITHHADRTTSNVTQK